MANWHKTQMDIKDLEYQKALAEIRRSVLDKEIELEKERRLTKEAVIEKKKEATLECQNNQHRLAIKMLQFRDGF